MSRGGFTWLPWDLAEGALCHEEGSPGYHGTWMRVLYVMRGVHLVTMGPG